MRAFTRLQGLTLPLIATCVGTRTLVRNVGYKAAVARVAQVNSLRGGATVCSLGEVMVASCPSCMRKAAGRSGPELQRYIVARSPSTNPEWRRGQRGPA